MNTPFRETAVLVPLGFGLTALTYAVGLYFGWITDFSMLEAFGVALNYGCVVLASRQNIWNWPIGIVAVLFLGVLFFQLNLYASLVLSLAYFLPAQIYGWYLWHKGKRPEVPLPVTNMSFAHWGILGLGLAVTYPAIVALNIYFGGALATADCAILALSVVAQWLMNHKKLESWYFWVAVNIISVVVYLKAGAFVLGIQYALFLLNASYGLYLWTAENNKRKANNLVFGRKAI